LDKEHHPILVFFFNNSLKILETPIPSVNINEDFENPLAGLL
jgi:hypothetical protein